jgi:phosphoribosyl-ATP pyrophosphohydrolase/phosphoribosyl-AMP cyclohydrolase/histidinol dehydrogenase
VRDAIDKAYDNVRKFHEAQITPPIMVETVPGVICERFTRPIARVGLYVPGGTAILPSSAYMLGIPAQVAGCEEIVLATPPREDGSISPEVMYVAHKVGATAILKAGGAQAIAALAYGTETCPKVDKIFGPGNQWVTAAKMLVQNDTDALVAIDMPAGPSEVLVSQIIPVTFIC